MTLLRPIAALALMASASPALATDNGKTPPGNPCVKSVGNPCNGNNGNSGSQGNAGKEKVSYGSPTGLSIPRPAVRDRSVFITQVDGAATANVTQTAPHAYARIYQSGDRNNAVATQRGSAVAYLDVRQTGLLNDAQVTQGGNASGGNTLYVTQTGNRNTLSASQTATYGENAAILGQYGNGNTMTLTQDGRDNLAQLTQNGDGNTMTPEQVGSGNRLIWTQNGNNLSDLPVRQIGGVIPGGSISITQSRQ